MKQTRKPARVPGNATKARFTLDKQLQIALEEAICALERGSSVAGSIRVELDNGRILQAQFSPVRQEREAKEPRGLFAAIFRL